jgi:hypothetical protein
MDALINITVTGTARLGRMSSMVRAERLCT